MKKTNIEAQRELIRKDALEKYLKENPEYAEIFAVTPGEKFRVFCKKSAKALGITTAIAAAIVASTTIGSLTVSAGFLSMTDKEIEEVRKKADEKTDVYKNERERRKEQQENK